MADEHAFLQPGRTCWRVETASRAALLIENGAYFAAAKAAMQKAQRSIWLLGWTFDPRTRLEPTATPGPDEQVGSFLKRLAKQRPDLDIHILAWQSQLAISASQGGYPQRAAPEFVGSRIKFRLDATTPFGACHHQKVLVIDDSLAFCGGGDLTVDRWDTPDHIDGDDRRRLPSGRVYPPRHEVMMMVEGAPATALAQLARERWRRATRQPAPSVAPLEPAPWPDHVEPEFHDVPVGIARTEPAWRGATGADEIEALHMRCILNAKRSIYLENQYVTSGVLADALCRRLKEPDGPEVVVVSTLRSPSWFDQNTMDRARNQFVHRLQESDVHDRFRAYTPVTRDRACIIVHSKVAIIDGRLLRAGSANLNNRSGGFDTECDLAIEAAEDDIQTQAAIRAFRSRLIGHYLLCGQEAFDEALTRTGSLARAVEALDDPERRRLKPIVPRGKSPLSRFVTRWGIGDPAGTHDSWRPWLRKSTLREERARLRWVASDD
ncbi:MAG TPA: phospholipase D-like domain-containing protein [Caulobacteraceae bacterium]